MSQALRRCLPSVSTLEVMLNSYASLPPCDWVDSFPADLSQVSRRCLSAPVAKLQFHQYWLSAPHPPFRPLRSTSLSSGCWVSVGPGLALCSISAAALCGSTSGPDVTQLSACWTFPPLSGNICCCGTVGRSSDVTQMTPFFTF